MSHDHGHAIPETPKTSSSAAFFAVLIFVGFILGLVNFTQSMGHSAEGHATAEHTPAHGEHTAPAHDEHAAPAAHDEHAAPAGQEHEAHEASNSEQQTEHH